MSGAYVAKPAVDLPPPEGPPTVDDVPPGWNLNWPFPGSYPPGYAPELTFPMTATEIIRFFGTAAATGEFRDHADFITNEPDAVILTAAIGGVAVNLRFSGDTEYASGISSDCILASYWNIAPDIEFELIRSQEGAIVVLTGTSAVDGVTVVGTANVAIYLPDYSLVMSGPAGITYNEAASVTVSLRDHETLGTDEPIGSTLIWTATIDGVTVGLRFSGDPAYSSSINSSYSDIGDYWGAEKSIEFDLTTENNSDTVVLRVESTIFGEDLATTIDIIIGEPYGIVTLTMTGNEAQLELHTNRFGALLKFGSDVLNRAIPYADVYHRFTNLKLLFSPSPMWEFYSSATEDEFEIRAPVADGKYIGGDGTGGVPNPHPWLIGECNANQIEIKALRFKPYWVLPWVPLTYEVEYAFYWNTSDGDVIYDFIFIMYSAGGDVLNTWTKQVILADNEGSTSWLPRIVWLTIDGATREVTVVNP